MNIIHQVNQGRFGPKTGPEILLNGINLRKAVYRSLLIDMERKI